MDKKFEKKLNNLIKQRIETEVAGGMPRDVARVEATRGAYMLTENNLHLRFRDQNPPITKAAYDSLCSELEALIGNTRNMPEWSAYLDYYDQYVLKTTS